MWRLKWLFDTFSDGFGRKLCWGWFLLAAKDDNSATEVTLMAFESGIFWLKAYTSCFLVYDSNPSCFASLFSTLSLGARHSSTITGFPNEFLIPLSQDFLRQMNSRSAWYKNFTIIGAPGLWFRGWHAAKRAGLKSSWKRLLKRFRILFTGSPLSSTFEKMRQSFREYFSSSTTRSSSCWNEL